MNGVIVSPIVRQGLRGAYPCANTSLVTFAQDVHGVGGVSVGGVAVNLSAWDTQYEDERRWGDAVVGLLKEVARSVVHGHSQGEVCVTLVGPGVRVGDKAGGNSLPSPSRVRGYFVDHQHILDNCLSIIAASNGGGGCGFLLRCSEEDCAYEVMAFPSAENFASKTLSVLQLTKAARSAYEVVVGEIFTQESVDRLHFFIRRRSADVQVVCAGCEVA